MSQWSPKQYFKFKSQKTKLAIDLAKRIPLSHPKIYLITDATGEQRICKKITLQAYILGMDNSEDIIRKAKEVCPDMDFQVCGIMARLDWCHKKTVTEFASEYGNI